MTPLVNPFPVPNRIDLISELVRCIQVSAPNLPEIRNDEKAKIAYLSMCEIALSLPPSMFTQKERIEILSGISLVYGDPFEFLRSLNRGESYVRQSPDCNNRSIVQIVFGVCLAHKEQFGNDLLSN